MLDSLKGLYRQQKLVATSDAIYSDLILRGLSPTRISRIDSGVACFPPITIYERARSRNRLGIRKEEVALALQGRMSSPADYGLLLRALSSLGDAGDRFRLYIIEPQDLDDAYHIIRLADKAGLLDQLTLCGYRDDVISVIKGMDVVVHISQTDKAALPILEAMSLAIPVVASRTDGIPELIEHGYNGLLFSSGCQAELASCLRSLADPALRQALGQAARATQQHRFTIDAMVRSTVALYRPGLSG
jgi:glycosyltransferase involved in cell wall biosynthesis